MTRRESRADHRLGAHEEHVHREWNRELEPVLPIRSGDVVRFECPEASYGNVTPETTVAEIPNLGLGPGHALVGPVAIEDASPGDVLEVELLEVDHGEWGWTAYWPDKGLLADHANDHGLHVWDLGDDSAPFVDGIEVPLEPFPGTIGVAPAAVGSHSTIPPRAVGGNLDVKYLTEGATLQLPVAVDDALFSVGDGHAAQGDGEVCLTGIEAPISVTARFTVRSDLEIDQPRYDSSVREIGGEVLAATGVGDDLEAASERAILELIDRLTTERGLSWSSAYILCSVAADLKINQLVNAPNWTVSAHLPKSIFD
ncbi:acetamidase/formamidase family protein [Natrarchaeobius oligotrophus]|uniref:Acetamidase n=1 Tax=Natrarchaeobius chitinivorans TaxID=1679083 RepID=A0A3N6MF09_NATCH|nr:acetamidase/formamidase family protein [Natrarchaeobius chitinivorans]RQH02604.1 acetamidase [Natrarchaeobius chitinivorans]